MRFLAALTFVCLQAPLLLAQAKPTDAKASSLVITFVKTHMSAELIEFPIQTAMSNPTVKSATIVRGGASFNRPTNPGHAELCVTIRLNPSLPSAELRAM